MMRLSTPSAVSSEHESNQFRDTRDESAARRQQAIDVGVALHPRCAGHQEEEIDDARRGVEAGNDDVRLSVEQQAAHVVVLAANGQVEAESRTIRRAQRSLERLQ